MANKPCINFAARLFGDGSSVSADVSFSSDPVMFQAYGSVDMLSGLFAATPTELKSITAGQTISSWSYSALTGKLSITFAAALPNNTMVDVNGVALY